MTTQESEVDVLAVMLFDAESSEIGQRRAGVGEAAVQARMKLSDAARAAVAEVFDALRKCRDYLSCIPESAAGGDDDAVALTQTAATALRNAGVKV